MMKSQNTDNVPIPLRTLILEDCETDAELMVVELRRAGFQVTWQRVDTATDYLAQLNENVQIILADYNLPQFDAVDALQILKARALDIPFLVVTGNINEEIAVDTVKQGAADYVFKDRLARLGPAVTRALEEKRQRAEKRRAEETLQESEKRFRALVEHSADAIALAHPDGTIFYASPEAARIVGAAPEQLVGRNTFDGVHPEDLERAKDIFTRVLQNPGSSLTSQFRLRYRDGSWRWVEGIGTNLLHEPSVRAMVANYRDITAHKRAEEALMQERTLLRTLIDNLPDYIYVKDRESRFILKNLAEAQLHGETSTDVTGKTVFDYAATEQVAQYHADDQAVMRSGETLINREEYVIDPDGNRHWLLTTKVPLKDQRSEIVGVIGIGRDITARRRAEEELCQRAAHQAALSAVIAAATEASTDLQRLMETAIDVTLKAFGLKLGAIWLVRDADRDPAFVVRGMSNDKAEAIAHAAVIAHENLTVATAVSDWELVTSPLAASVRAQGIRSSISVPLLADGKRIGGLSIASSQPRPWSTEEVELTVAIGRQLGIAIDRARLLNDTREYARRLELLHDAGLSLNQSLDLSSLMDTLLNTMNKIVRADRTDFLRFDPTHQTLTPEFGVGYAQDFDVSAFHATSFAVGEERGLAGLVAANRTPLYIAHLESDPRWIPFDPSIRSGFWLPIEQQGELRGILVVTSKRVDAFSPADRHMITLIANQLDVALENVRLFDETRQRLAVLEAINRISTALRAAQSLDEMLRLLLDQINRVLDATAATIWLYDPVKDELNQVVESGFPHLAGPVKPGEGIGGRVFTSGQVYVSQDFKSDSLTLEAKRDQIPAGLGGACVPIRAADKVIGLIFVSVQPPRQLSQDSVNLLAIAAEIAGNAIHRTLLHEQTTEQLSHITALYTIDRAITSSFDMRVTFDVILEQITTQLQVDAADILLFDPSTQTLKYHTGRGFRTSWIATARVALGEAHAGCAVVDRRAVCLIENITEGCSTAFAELVKAEGFVSYYGIPLIGKGQVKGVLEIFHRRSLVTTREWETFMEALAEQSAIALENAMLFADLERSNTELTLAYDETLEGWSRALDLRDKETEGHTQRVTEMTMHLARVVGIPEADWVHVRRGALLHDIGKIGIPDNILLKPGSLTDDEWKIMRRHPELAYELLHPIAYLRPALDIPSCHHEKWDGTGYPRGLKGEQIPLAARVFAVVDVWDALRSTRPYRAVWPDRRVRQYLHEASGKHFDPAVVQVFLEMLGPIGDSDDEDTSDARLSRPRLRMNVFKT